MLDSQPAGGGDEPQAGGDQPQKIASSLSEWLNRPGALLPRAQLPEDAVRQILSLHEASGGATFGMYWEDLAGQQLYAVSLYPERGIIVDEELPPDLLRAFIVANRDLLQDPRNCIGTWLNVDDGATYLDVSAVLSDRDQAEQLARLYNQIAIFDLQQLETISTGGTGIPIEDVPPPHHRLPPLTEG